MLPAFVEWLLPYCHPCPVTQEFSISIFFANWHVHVFCPLKDEKMRLATKKPYYQVVKTLFYATKTKNDEKLKKKFFSIFHPHGLPQPTPRSRARGNFSKIASVAQNIFTSRPYMSNFRSLACSVWAVGRGGLLKRYIIFNNVATCNKVLILLL